MLSKHSTSIPAKPEHPFLKSNDRHIAARHSGKVSIRIIARLLSIALALVLVFLTGFAFWAVILTRDLSHQVRDASLISDLYEQARFAIGQEEALENKFRIEPKPETRTEYGKVTRTLIDALNEVKLRGTNQDKALVEEVLSKHQLYVSAMYRLFDAMDQMRPALALKIDTEEIDPIFDYIQSKVYDAANRHHGVAFLLLDEQDKTQNMLYFTTPLVFALGLILLVVIWLILRNYQKMIERSRQRDIRRNLENALRQAEAEQEFIRRSEKRYRALVQNASGFIIIIDQAGKVSSISPSITAALGYNSEELLNTDFFQIFQPDDLARFQYLMLDTAANKVSTALESRVRHKNGEWRYLEVVVTNLLHEEIVGGIVINAHDITERKKFENELQHQAFHDALTGLPNRALFLDRFEHALLRTPRKKGRLALLFLDLDSFKLVNDSLGHKAGDDLLVQVARRLQGLLRHEDTISRLGGDEFTVLIEEINEGNEPCLIAQRILEALQKPFTIQGRELYISASIGVVVEDKQKQESPGELLSKGDMAMYQAKNNGKGQCAVYEASMHEQVVDRVELEANLRKALELNELSVFYQPIVDLRSGTPIGLEALMRWNNAERGFIPPATFIPIAEETGLIAPLGAWILKNAAEQARQWNHNNPHPLMISVNLSTRQFLDPDLSVQIAKIIKETGIEPALLQLEITESAIMENAETNIQILHKLKELGVKIAVDDFGTGYSSLSYLKNFPIDTLKIDRSFVKRLDRDEENRAIVRAVINLAEALNLKVVAEGIEMQAERDELFRMGCTEGQGYLYGKPVPAAEFDNLLTAGKPLPSPFMEPAVF